MMDPPPTVRGAFVTGLLFGVLLAAPLWAWFIAALWGVGWITAGR